MDDIVSGAEVLGVLLARKGRSRVLWYGSVLDVHTARSRLPNTQATTLTVVAAALAATVYAIRHPTLGFVEPDDMDYKEILDVRNLESIGGFLLC